MSNLRNAIGVVLVGIGRMGKNHLRVIRQDPRFRLQAIVDSYAAPPEPIGETRFFRSVDELDDVDYDCAIVVTPSSTHFEVASRFIERGKHLLVEKPLATTFDRSRRLMRACQEKRLHLAVGHVERFNPAVRKLHEVIKGGWIGTPIHFSLTRVGGYPESLLEGNNVLLDLAVHDLDILRSIVGPLKLHASVCHATIQDGVCDTAEILLSSANGQSATVHVNWITPTKIRNMRVTGTHGVCFIDYILQTCTVVGGNLLKAAAPASAGFEQLVEMYKNTDRIEFGVRKDEPLKAQLDQLHELLAKGDAGELCLGPDAAAAVRLAELALQHGQTPTQAWKRPGSCPPLEEARNDDDWI